MKLARQRQLQRADQPRLADAALAGDQHDATSPCLTCSQRRNSSSSSSSRPYRGEIAEDCRASKRFSTLLLPVTWRTWTGSGKRWLTNAPAASLGVGALKATADSKVGERCRAIGLGSPDLKLGVAPTMRYQRHPWRGAPDAPSTIAADGSSRRARREADCPWRASGLLSGASALVCFHT